MTKRGEFLVFFSPIFVPRILKQTLAEKKISFQITMMKNILQFTYLSKVIFLRLFFRILEKSQKNNGEKHKTFRSVSIFEIYETPEPFFS